MKHIISAYNFSRDELEDIFALTDKYSKNLNDTRKILSGKTISIAFFSPGKKKILLNGGDDDVRPLDQRRPYRHHQAFVHPETRLSIL